MLVRQLHDGYVSMLQWILSRGKRHSFLPLLAGEVVQYAEKEQVSIPFPSKIKLVVGLVRGQFEAQDFSLLPRKLWEQKKEKKEKMSTNQPKRNHRSPQLPRYNHGVFRGRTTLTTRSKCIFYIFLAMHKMVSR